MPITDSAEQHKRHHSSHHHPHRHHERPHKRRRSSSPAKPVTLPFNAQALSKHDLETYKPLFASYLDLQKQKDIFDLSDSETKGRWKSFYHKWNRGDLAQGWYEPNVKARADRDWAAAQLEDEAWNAAKIQEEHADDSNSDVGPAPAAVTFEALAERDEARADAVDAHRSELRAARKADRQLQRERLDEVVPRAETGTRERMLEKKREAGDAARTYREGKANAGDAVEVNEADLMGSGGFGEAKAMRVKEQARKSEREQRRAEIWEARKVEREERMAGAKEKEAKTMDLFKRLAAERFGARTDLPSKGQGSSQDEKIEKSVAEKFNRH